MTPNRKRAPGFTLIDLMVAVSILSIGTYMLGGLFTQRRQSVVDAAQEERALQWLEYEADVRLEKRASDPTVVNRLREGLPDAAFSALPPDTDKSTTLRVDWRAASGRIRSLELKLVGVKP